MQMHIEASLLQHTELFYPETVNVAKHPVGKHNDSLRPRGLARVFSELHLPHVWVSKNQRGPSHNADGRVLGCAIGSLVIFEIPEYTIQVPHQPRAGNKVDGLFGPWDAKIAASAQSPTAEESPMMPNQGPESHQTAHSDHVRVFEGPGVSRCAVQLNWICIRKCVSLLGHWCSSCLGLKRSCRFSASDAAAPERIDRARKRILILWLSVSSVWLLCSKRQADTISAVLSILCKLAMLVSS